MSLLLLIIVPPVIVMVLAALKFLINELIDKRRHKRSQEENLKLCDKHDTEYLKANGFVQVECGKYLNFQKGEINLYIDPFANQWRIKYNGNYKVTATIARGRLKQLGWKTCAEQLAEKLRVHAEYYSLQREQLLQTIADQT